MSSQTYSVITGTGSYIPPRVIPNSYFLNSVFYDKDGILQKKDNQTLVTKFEEITTIAERRYVDDAYTTSDIAFFAAQKAIENAQIDPETLDYVIVAHNFGDVRNDNKQVDIVPSLASRVKFLLGIANPETVAYDLPFGCPGWLQAYIQADYFIKSGDAKRILVIGADILSRISDPHDVDSMIYADGAGAIILEGKVSSTPIGSLAHKTRSDTLLHSQMLFMGKSFHPDTEAYASETYLKMNGRKLYQYALETVPLAIKACLEKSGTDIKEVKKVLIHQANGKMDDAILQRLYSLYDMEAPANIMPMTVSYLGNSSVATVPTLLDLILRGELPPHEICTGDIVVFASVGAGMNINALVYRVG